MISNLPVSEVAAVIARALEELLGHDVVLSTGAAELGDPADDLLPAGPTRTIVLPFSDGVLGEVSLVVGEPFAMAMEAATDDASLTTAVIPALNAGASTIAFTINVSVNVVGAGEIATETLLTSVVGEFAAVPIFENDTRVACVIVRLVDEEPVPIPAAAPIADPPSMPQSMLPPTPAPPSMPGPPRLGAGPDPQPANALLTPAPVPGLPAPIAIHEFQPLNDGLNAANPPRSLTLLNDVHMEVTAELGRRRLKVRDIVALEIGSVVELDRAAGSPVDVLVNGALVWHGEVVVVDEEFGIRVAEIVVDEN